ncbi:hypothetical protein ASPZODRAFT_805088 [Penicilliopsis zonata CBS 506.65]|uniref:Uncharacterized protein n=1 Tax=Penicilliopsis zonata CBS 506.65 TaxID=1073090 RepID=A0A1L9S9X8_9EURO|nr:hypothetical protein ASPZODRAFT_805088 [Penicilliopsis zonata CBS 506.65]OJJ43983.1 hypothetical protein ASPZODRAFT_805088 [Penicilliopsis zonata CBS 506.65]
MPRHEAQMPIDDPMPQRKRKMQAWVQQVGRSTCRWSAAWGEELERMISAERMRALKTTRVLGLARDLRRDSHRQSSTEKIHRDEDARLGGRRSKSEMVCAWSMTSPCEGHLTTHPAISVALRDNEILHVLQGPGIVAFRHLKRPWWLMSYNRDTYIQRFRIPGHSHHYAYHC